MKTVAKILTKWMESVVAKYPHVYFRYSFSPDKNTYYINAFPSWIVDVNDEYAKSENAIVEKLLKLYPDTSILFTSEERLFKVHANSFLIEKKRSYYKVKNKRNNNYQFYTTKGSGSTISNDYVYA